MGKLTDAAKAVILGEDDSKSTFNANIASKMHQRGGERAPKGEVGINKLPTSTVSGQGDAGEIGQSPEEKDDQLPDYLKGTHGQATPPGATPPVGAQGDGVGISKPQGQPQETMGRHDLVNTQQSPATDYEAIRDRIMGKLAPQMMQANPGATFQSYHEDIEALLSGEDLSEEFKTKATTIYEAAVSARVVAISEEIEEALTAQFEEAVEQVKEELASKVDDYLNYMVEEWITENTLAIEHGLKTEIVEDFITGLKGLFEQHYIDIPEDKVDVVEELTTKVEILEDELNETIKTAIELTKELNEHKKYEAIHAVCEGLTQTQVEKMKALAESTEFTTEEEFAEKLAILRESYFSNSVKPAEQSGLDEEVLIEEETKKPVSGTSDLLVEQIAQTISKSMVK